MVTQRSDLCIHRVDVVDTVDIVDAIGGIFPFFIRSGAPKGIGVELTWSEESFKSRYATILQRASAEFSGSTVRTLLRIRTQKTPPNSVASRGLCQEFWTHLHLSRVEFCLSQPSAAL